jgi:uncharacterized protein YbjT (DUF2867 family)
LEPRILVTGGTGTLGALVVRRLHDGGRAVRVLSRRAPADTPGVEHVRADLDTGEGVDAALTGDGVVVHCAGGRTGDDRKARSLVRSASRRGGMHLVNISVVGADRVPVESRLDRVLFGYFASKRAAEEVVAGSGLPWTTLRATQFHDLLLMTARQMTRLPLVPVFSGFRFQPVDAGEVADRLVALAAGEPSLLVPDIAGPRVYTMSELVRTYLESRRKRRRLVSVRLPGRAARALRAGANLAPDRAVGRRTWEAFLAATPG